MAKKDKIKVDNTFDVDSDLDMPDFNFEDIDVKDDRKPIVKFATSIPKGALDGLKDTGFLKNTLKDALPNGFGQTIDLADQTNDSIKTLYDDTVRQIKPAVKEFKRVLPKLVPSDNKLVPKSVKNLLQKWIEESKTQSADLDIAQQRDAMMSSQMADIFQAQVKLDQIQNNENIAKDRLAEGISLSQHKDMFSLSNSQAISLSKIEQYNTNVDLAYKKKSLELQYRSLFVLQDQISLSKEQNEQQSKLLSNVIKNTGLPEFVKLNNIEYIKQSAKNKFSDTISNGLFGDRNKLIASVTENISSKLKNKLSELKDGLIDGLSAAESGKEMSQDMPGLDKSNMLGGTVGSTGIQAVTGKVVSKYRDRFLNSKLSNKLDLKTKSTKLSTFVENAPNKLADFKSKDYTFDDSPLAPLKGFLQSLINTGKVDNKLKTDSLTDLNAPEGSTRKTNKALTQIIPGYLSRILREVQVFRTGNTKIELTKYDFEADRFSSGEKLATKILSKAIDKQSANYLNKDLDKTVKDITADKKVDKKTIDAIRKALLENSSDRKTASISNLSKDKLYNGVDESTKEKAKELLSQFILGLDDDGKLKFAKATNRLADYIKDNRELIQTYSDIGNKEELRKSGLVNKNNEIDIDKILNYYLEQQDNPEQDKLDQEDKKKKSLALRVDRKRKINTKKQLDTKLAPVKEFTNKISNPVTNKLQGLKDKSNPYINKGLDNVKDIYNKSKDKLKSNYGNNYNNIISKIPKDIKLQGLKDKLKSSYQNIFNIGSSSFSTNENKSNLNTKDLPKDIYVEGESIPRLEAIKLDAGKYRDKVTNKIIKSLEDINSDVVDENNNTVISKKDLLLLRYYNAKSKVFEKYENSKTKLIASSSKYSPIISNKLSNFSSSIKSNLTSAWNAIGPDIKDVYVKGEKEPRLYASKLKAGKYRNKDTNSVIVDASSINSDVVDENNNTVISKKEINNLVVFEPRFKRFAPLRTLLSSAKTLGGALWHYQTVTAVNWTKWNFKQIGKVLTFTKNLISRKFKDVYVGSEKEPRLYASRIKAGEYYHVSDGSVLKNQNDIKGAIRDSDGNIVISNEDLANLRVYESVFKWLNPFKLSSLAIKAVSKLGLSTFKAGWKASRFLLNTVGSAATSVIKGVVGFLTKPVDVYIAGKNKPALLAKEIKEGKYFSAKTGKALTHHNQIDGAVLDINGETILSEEEALSGIYDITGKRLNKGGLFKLIGKGFKAFSKATSYRTNLLNIKSLPKNQKDAEKKGISGSEYIQSKSLNTLESIKSIIDKKFNKKKINGDVDGDGIRENSTEDKLRKAGLKDKFKPPISKQEKDKPKEKDGFLGKLLGVLGGFAGGLVGKLASFLTMFGKGTFSLLGSLSKIGLGLLARIAPAVAAGMAGVGALGGGKLGKLGKLTGVGLKLLKGASIVGAGAYAVDAIAGKLGAGGNEIDQQADDANWSKMSLLEKMQSGAARGIEKVGEFAFMDNIANSAKASRIKKESEYLKNKEQISSSITPTTVDLDKDVLKSISALHSIRYKTYGLNEFDKTKVSAIYKLEKSLLKDVVFDSKNVASFTGNILSIYRENSSSFGIRSTSNINENGWVKWFRARFLPVYLAYVSSCKVYNSDGFDDKLSSIQSLQIANSLVGIDVWNNTDSPFSNYKLSTDKSITVENFNYLENTNVTTIIKDQSSASIKTTSFNESPKLNNNSTTTPNNNGGFMDYYKKSIPQASPDLEPKPNESLSSATPNSSNISVNTLTKANGQIYDGRNAHAYLQMGKGVSLDKLNPQLLKNFYGMVEEFGTLTGKKVPVNDGHRTYEEQASLFNKLGKGKAAAPGSSLHEYGLALDADSKTLNLMEEMGLMRKYGFTRPVGGEPWHVEPIGTQGMLNSVKADPVLAEKAIMAGMGRGGSGLGIMDGARKYSRDANVSNSIMNASSSNIDNSLSSKLPEPVLSGPSKITPVNVVSNTSGLSTIKPTFNVPSSYSDKPATPDLESKPKLMTANLPSSSSPTGLANTNTMPKDPTVKIPDIKSVGYEGVKDTVVAAAKMVGINPDLAIKTVAVESGFNPNAKASSSSASGLFQFIKSTWDELINKFGSKYGFNSGTSPFDPKANSILGAHYLKQASDQLSSSGNKVGATEIYLSHFLGPTGAKVFLSNYSKDPSLLGSDILPNAAKSNPSIFYDGSRARTLSEIYSLLDNKVSTKASSFGIKTETTQPLDVKQINNNKIESTVSLNSKSIISSSPNSLPVDDSKTLLEKTARVPSISPTYSPKDTVMPSFYGFEKNTPTKNIQQNNPNQISAEVMQPTNKILESSLDTQKAMLKALNDIFGIVNKLPANLANGLSNKDDSNKLIPNQSTNSNLPSIKPYSSPKAAVPMTKNIF